MSGRIGTPWPIHGQAAAAGRTGFENQRGATYRGFESSRPDIFPRH